MSLFLQLCGIYGAYGDCNFSFDSVFVEAKREVTGCAAQIMLRYQLFTGVEAWGGDIAGAGVEVDISVQVFGIQRDFVVARFGEVK